MGKWAHRISLSWHFASAVIKGKSMSMHALTERSFLPDSWGLRGICNGIASQSASQLKFLTFSGLLVEVCWICELSVLCSNFIQHCEASSCSYLHTSTYICLTYSTITAEQHAPFKLGIVRELSILFNIMWIIVCMHWVEKGMYNSFIPEWDNFIYCLTK